MKQLCLILTACLVCLTGCTGSNQGYYERAQRYLGAGDYDTAAYLFDQLGEYEDSADYAAYARALDALETGDLALARRAFTALDGFKHSAQYLIYLDAQEAGPAEALVLYESLGAFADSAALADVLRDAVPEEALTRARRLMEARSYAEALAVLHDQQTGAAEELTEACREALYRAAESRYPTADLADAPSLMADYAALAGFQESAARLAELTERFAAPLTLLGCAEANPYVYWGSYPASVDGTPSPMLWRVVRVEGTTVTLLAEHVLDAAPLATPSDLSALTLPDAGLLTLLPETLRRCEPTEYAVSHGVAVDADGAAAWLLADRSDSEQLAVLPDGTVGALSAQETSSAGVRPVVVVPLTDLSLTGGDGSREDPFD